VYADIHKHAVVWAIARVVLIYMYTYIYIYTYKHAQGWATAGVVVAGVVLVAAISAMTLLRRRWSKSLQHAASRVLQYTATHCSATQSRDLASPLLSRETATHCNSLNTCVATHFSHCTRLQWRYQCHDVGSPLPNHEGIWRIYHTYYDGIAHVRKFDSTHIVKWWHSNEGHGQDKIGFRPNKFVRKLTENSWHTYKGHGPKKLRFRPDNFVQKLHSHGGLLSFVTACLLQNIGVGKI